MYYPDNSARWRLEPSQMSHHVDCYVVTDDVEECNVSNFRADWQLDTKDGGTMALKHPLLFTSRQSIACCCAWMFITTAVKISNLTKLARFVLFRCQLIVSNTFHELISTMGSFTVESTPSKRPGVVYSCKVCRWNAYSHFQSMSLLLVCIVPYQFWLVRCVLQFVAAWCIFNVARTKHTVFQFSEFTVHK